MTSIARFLRRRFAAAPRHQPPPDDDENIRPPDAGKPAPLSPSPTHHLVAAQSLPPGETTHLFPAN